MHGYREPFLDLETHVVVMAGQVGTVFIGIHSQSYWRGNWDFRATEDGIDFVHRLGTNVGCTTMSRTTMPWAVTPLTLSSTTWVLRRTVTVEGDRIVFKIVTSAVRINVALTFSRWRSLFASPIRVAQSVARACSCRSDATERTSFIRWNQSFS